MLLYKYFKFKISEYAIHFDTLHSIQAAASYNFSSDMKILFIVLSHLIFQKSVTMEYYQALKVVENSISQEADIEVILRYCCCLFET